MPQVCPTAPGDAPEVRSSDRYSPADMATRRGAYPGTFNPPTVAHLAIADAARAQCALDVVELVVSRVPLGKHDHPELAPLDERIEVLERMATAHAWLEVTLSDAQLLADLAIGYDVVVLGADKWAQVVDERWYADASERDRAVASLPTVALAPRPPHPLPPAADDVVVLEIDPALAEVSASAVRAGATAWLAPGAAGDRS
jgi:hypothetical protein